MVFDSAPWLCEQYTALAADTEPTTTRSLSASPIAFSVSVIRNVQIFAKSAIASLLLPNVGNLCRRSSGNNWYLPRTEAVMGSYIAFDNKL